MNYGMTESERTALWASTMLEQSRLRDALEIANAKLERVKEVRDLIVYAHRDAPCTDECVAQIYKDLGVILSQESNSSTA